MGDRGQPTGGNRGSHPGHQVQVQMGPGRWRGGTGGRGPIAAVTVTQLTRDAETVPSRCWGWATRYPAVCLAAQKNPRHRQRPGPKRHCAIRPTCPPPPLRGFITAVGPGCLPVACSSARSLKLEDRASSPPGTTGSGTRNSGPWMQLQPRCAHRWTKEWTEDREGGHRWASHACRREASTEPALPLPTATIHPPPARASRAPRW